jgi:hypothetical protein
MRSRRLSAVTTWGDRMLPGRSVSMRSKLRKEAQSALVISVVLWGHDTSEFLFKSIYKAKKKL